MNTHQLTSRLVEAGIDPASVVVRVNGQYRALAKSRHPGLRGPTPNQLRVLQKFGIPVKFRDHDQTEHPLYQAMHQSNVGVVTDPSLAHVFAGWNVWAVDQVKDLPFDPMMIGIDRSRQLRIWVEDQVRLHAGGASVADPIDLKGSQVEILANAPTGLSVFQHKEQVPGDPMLASGETALMYVRFFNRGSESNLPWPHDESYILDQVLTPSPNSPATIGPGPGTITSRAIDPTVDVLKGALVVVSIAAVGVLGVQLLQARRRAT